MPKQKELVSVIMSCYNSEQYLMEAIKSILNQTYSKFEFIIVNDGSTDSTLDIIKSIKDSRIIILNQENQGLATALNNAIKIAKGKYILRMDADDISLSHRIQKQVSFMESNPEVGVLGSAIIFIDEKDNQLGRSFSLLSSRLIEKFILNHKGNVMAHPSVIIRKELFDKYGGYCRHMTFSQDYQLWSKFLRKGVVFKNLKEALLKYRINENSTGSKMQYTEESLKRLYEVLAEDNPTKQMVDNLKQSLTKNKTSYHIRYKHYQNIENRIFNFWVKLMGRSTAETLVTRLKNMKSRILS